MKKVQIKMKKVLMKLDFVTVMNVMNSKEALTSEKGSRIGDRASKERNGRASLRLRKSYIKLTVER